MGAGQSTASNVPQRALHVLRVTPSSPASQTTIEPFFDFVIGFKGDSFNAEYHNTVDATELENIVESHEGRPLNLLVWNSKNQETRVVPIIPSRDWSLPRSSIPDPREPHEEQKPSLLGLSMRMCEPEFALDNVWHVLDVLEGSPAESAGLVPYGDWIIGWSGGVLSAEGDFYDVVEAHIDKPLRVYVYSFDFDTIREVVLVPNRHWGGEGLLGCVFGFGLLHRIPPLPEDREPGSIPPELVLDSEDYEEQQLFVPADLGSETETPEQMAERLQWEHEQWAREEYARNFGDHTIYEESEGQPHEHHPAQEAAEVQGYDVHHDHAHHDHDHDHHNHNHNHAHDYDDHSHDHSHDHDHDHDHEFEHIDHAEHSHNHDAQNTSEPRAATPVAPFRSSSFSGARSSTPTPTRPSPLGTYMNGIGLTGSPRTPSYSWDGRGAGVGFLDRGSASGDADSKTGYSERLRGGDEDGMSVEDADATETETETETELDSEIASQGSLTSID